MKITGDCTFGVPGWKCCSSTLSFDDKLYGDNTDWIAIYDSIPDTTNRIHILVSGGVSRAAIYAGQKKNKNMDHYQN